MVVRIVQRCLGASSSIAPSRSILISRSRKFSALAARGIDDIDENNFGTDGGTAKTVDKYADIGVPCRKVSPRVYAIVDKICTLTDEEKKQLEDRLIKKLIATPVKAPKNYQPFPVRARVPFPHPEALFAGIFSNRMPGNYLTSYESKSSETVVR